MAVVLASAAAPPARAGEGEALLLRLADRALAEGDLDTARSRYQRLLDAHAGPDGAARARVGLGDVAARRGDATAAAEQYEAALELDPTLAPAQLGLAELARASGDADAARARLDAALAAAPLSPRLHARLFEWTGLAPAAGESDASPEGVRARARAYPYDPRAQLALARLALADGDEAGARAALETTLLVADLAPQVAPEAAALLARLDAAERRFVPVHLYADETVRAEPGWEFELRIAWGRASVALRPVLATTFVPVAIRPFSSQGVADDLASIHRAMSASLERAPLDGILAGFTRRDSPRTPLAHRLGEAEYFGRELMVRIDPDDLEGRTLAHEVLHLYGAMHLSDEIPSLMNPMAVDWTLDSHTARILRVTRERRFGPGSFERNVLARVDVPALADALVAAIRVNVAFRNQGLEEATEAAEESRWSAALRARAATGEDRPLA
ncbi:MAG TPA: tetratricopeptide repeat protein, partial [Myxococcota bacterium]|nr:tetratricopeptide repeat protein [Myxococcota bacterium]